MQTYILIQLLCQLIPTLGFRDDDYDDNQDFLSLPSKGLQCSVAKNLGNYKCNSKDYMRASKLEDMAGGLTYFDHRLGCFLETVWDNKESIESMNDVYGMYVGVSESGSPDLNDTQLLQFVKKVGELVREKTHDGKGLQLQSGLQLQLWEKVSATRNERRYLWTDFYHMWPLDPMPDGSVVATRLYVHASTPMHGLAIVEAIFDYCSQNSDRHGVEHLKIAGPGAVRDDNIVVYLTNPRKIMFLAEALAGLDTSLFSPTLPPLVEPIRPGVGFADEPTIIEGKETAMVSFGSLYSDTIFDAIEKTRKKENTDLRFLKEVWKELKVTLKLDPCNHASFIRAASKETQQNFANDAVVYQKVDQKVAVPLSA